MKVALLTTDNREPFREHHKSAPWFGTAPEALLQGFARLPEVEVHVISCIRLPVRSPEKIAPNIYFHSLVVPKLGWMRTFYQGCIRATRKKLKEIRPDIVHGQGTELDCGLSAALSGFPSVLTIHGNIRAIAELHQAKIGSFYWLAGRLENFVLPRTGGVFCNSAYTEGLVAPRARRTWRVPNALRLDFFETPSGRQPHEKAILLNIGLMQPRKQQLELLRLAGRLHRRGLKFELRFAGERALNTPYGAAFAGELAAAEAAGYARHLGLLNTAQLIAALDAADALVHFPTEEAFGLVTAEALARGLKFFGSAVGGGIEIAAGVEGAELFPAGDFPGLENAVGNWLAVGCPRPPGAADLMRQRYHPEAVARRHLEIYREVLRA